MPTPQDANLGEASCATTNGYIQGNVFFTLPYDKTSDAVHPDSTHGEVSSGHPLQRPGNGGVSVPHFQSGVSGFVDGRAVPGVPLRMQVTLKANHLPEGHTLNGMVPEIVVFYAQQCAFCKLATAGDPCCGKMQPESITLNYSETGDQKSAIFTFKATPTGEFLESDASCAQNAGDRIVLIDPST